MSWNLESSRIDIRGSAFTFLLSMKAKFLVAIAAECSFFSALGFALAQDVKPSPNQYEARTFRYELTTRSGDFIYADEFTNHSDHSGPYYNVEIDSQGRLARVVTVHDGKSIAQKDYFFSGNAKLPNGYKLFEAGEQVGIVLIQRNEDGSRKKIEHKTLEEKLTGFSLYFYNTDNVERVDYSAERMEKQHFKMFFSIEKRLTHFQLYRNGDTKLAVTEVDVSELTGLMLYAKQFNNGQLANTQTFLYDTKGNVANIVGYDGSGKWLTTTYFVAGLLSKKIYRGPDTSAGREFDYFHDKTRRLSETKVFFHDAYICSLFYERLSDDTVDKTVAKGPDGTVWAEYPNAQVLDIKSNGQSVNSTNVVIYKHVPWW